MLVQRRQHRLEQQLPCFVKSSRTFGITSSSAYEDSGALRDCRFCVSTFFDCRLLCLIFFCNTLFLKAISICRCSASSSASASSNSYRAVPFVVECLFFKLNYFIHEFSRFFTRNHDYTCKIGIKRLL